jgi:hypothetical protein
MPMPLPDHHYVSSRVVLAAALNAAHPSRALRAVRALPASIDMVRWWLAVGMLASGTVGWLVATAPLR